MPLVSRFTAITFEDLWRLTQACEAFGDPEWLTSIHSSGNTSLSVLMNQLGNGGKPKPVASVLTEDLWSALDALDALPETHETEWYKRLAEAAELATQSELTQSGVVTKH